MFYFENYLAKLNKEPKWLQDKRNLAWQEYSKLPMPNPSEEGWRVLDLDIINLDNLLDNLKTLPCSGTKAHDLSMLDKHLAGYEQMLDSIKERAGIIIESSEGVWFYLDEETAKKGVVISTLADAVQNDKTNEHIQSYYCRHLDNLDKPLLRANKFALLNDSICQNGVFVYIPENVELKKPLIYLNLHSKDTQSLTMSRLLLVADKNAHLSFVSVLATEGNIGKGVIPTSNKLSLANCLLEVYLEAGAHLNYVEVQNFSQDTFSIGHSYYTLERDSNLNSLVTAFGGEQLKSEMQVIMQDRGAQSSLNGVILGNETEHFNFNTIEDHLAPDTKSNIDFRIALQDEAQSIYHGTIQVAKAAQKTEAFQSNKNLLLGKHSHADSIPKLEILADDVKCSHGATVGPVDKKQIFYLMSRGLTEPQAEELIVNGFFHQLLNNCPIAGVSDWLDLIVAEKIASCEVKPKQAKTNREPALTR